MTIRTRAITAIAVSALAAAALTGCAAAGQPSAGTSDEPSTSSSPTETPSPTPTAAPVLATGASSHGTIVVNGAGMTVYYFDADPQGTTKSACTGACMTHWPAVDSDSATPTVKGVTGTVSTIMGNDGKLQVTLDGHPLYTWFEDKNPGDVTGQGLDKVWWVVSPDGTKITG